jgi:superfamily II DNA/RNA helicase
VSTQSPGADAPAITFGQLGLPDALVACLRRQDITTPLPIQAATIADALAGRDVAAKAATGSGKTLAFALPIAATLGRGTPRHPAGLVLAPTRELASQIAEAMRPLLATRGLKVATFYGGVGFGPQRNALRRGVDVAVACPGRLEDLVSQGEVSLSKVEIAVVDEADRMADMGFLPAVRRLLDATAADRQTLLYSATLDNAVDVLTRRYQRDPVRHEIAPTREHLDLVSHHFQPVVPERRVATCADLVGGHGTSIVFVRTKHGADRLTQQLSRAGVSAAPFHGGRSQAQRERALAAFRNGRVTVLVATDVAARGIHVDDVSRVVHYDLPADSKDYIHRSGRTARAGAAGSVVALVVPDQAGLAASLRRELKLGGDDDGRGAPQPRRQPKPRHPTPGAPRVNRRNDRTAEAIGRNRDRSRGRRSRAAG